MKLEPANNVVRAGPSPQSVQGGARARAHYKCDLKDQPLITVVTIVYNGESTLEATILSVLNQTYDNVEYVIVDGDSVDGTLDIIRKYNDVIDYWVSEKDSGIADAMNKAALLASGSWVIYMNAGDKFADCDVISSIFREAQLDGVSIVYGDAMLTQGGSQLKRVDGNHHLLTRLDSHNPICHQAAFTRRDVLQKFLFRHYKYSMDLDFWLRLTFAQVNFMHVNVVVANYELGGISSAPSHALKVLIEHRLIKMLHFQAYSWGAILKLVADFLWLSLKVGMRKCVGDQLYAKLKVLIE